MTRFASIIAPEWSLETPSMAQAYLTGAIDGKYEHKKFDLNLESAKLLKNQYGKYWSPVGHFFWTNPESFENDILPILKSYYDSVLDELATFDVVGFTIYFSNALVTNWLGRELRKRNKDIKIIYGGPACWNREKWMLQDASWCDAVCGAEGDEIIVDILDCVDKGEDFSSVLGLWWKQRGENGEIKCTFNLPRPMIRDLGTLPIPNFDDINIQDYGEFHYSTKPTLPIQGSRGCTAKCTFCAETRTFRFKRADKIYDEVVSMNKRYGIHDFQFVDSLVNGSMGDFKKFVEMINSTDSLNVSFGGYARTHKKMTPELCKEAGKAGFTWLSFGVESGTPKLLELMEKRQKVEVSETTLYACKAGGIRADVNWITGYPQETPVDWITSLMFLYRNRYNIPVVAANQLPAGITPGTPLDIHRENYDTAPNGCHIIWDWTSKNYDNTFINRFLRLKYTHAFIDMIRIYFSGFWDIRDSYKLNITEPRNEMTQGVHDNHDNQTQGSYWYNLQFGGIKNYFSNKKFKSHEHELVGKPEEYKDDFIDCNVPFLEEQNIPHESEHDGTPPEEVIKKQLREDTKAWLYFLWKVFGGFTLDFDLTEDYMERNAEGAEFNIKFKFEVTLDGKYKIKYNNKLKYDENGLRSTNVRLIDKNGNERYQLNYDLSFTDEFEEEGDMSAEFEDKEYLIKKYGVPNYIDMNDTEKYKVNFPRPENMRF